MSRAESLVLLLLFWIKGSRSLTLTLVQVSEAKHLDDVTDRCVPRGSPQALFQLID